MKFSLYALDRQLAIDWDVDEVVFYGPKGETGILPGHAPLVSLMTTGVLRCKIASNQQVHRFAISRGFIQVKDDVITACGYTIEKPEEIDVTRAKKAKQNALSKLKGLIESEEEFKKYQMKLERSTVRQKVAKSKDK